MSTDSWLALFAALAALVVLDLAAVVDQTLAAVNRVTIRALLEEHNALHRADSLVDHPQAVRSAMLVVQLVAAAFLVGDLSTLLGPWLAVVAGIVAMILVGRVLPGVVVGRHGEPRSYERLAKVLGLLVRPFTAVSDALIRLATPRSPELSSADGAEPRDDDALQNQDTNGSEQGEIQEEEQEMISGVLHLEEATAREIMLPRPDIVAVSIDTPLPQVVDVARQRGHSRIPVYRDSIDTIVGVVYAKDFLRFVNEDFERANLADLLRPAYFVPQSKRIGELLQDLRRSKVHLAVVVDEYGGTAGLVTIEDILEEIVGEIQDEYDREMPLLERVGPTEVIVDGRIAIDDVAEIFETEFEDGHVETIGGFVQQKMGRIPKAGESVRFDGLLIEVQSVEHHRIRKLRVVRVNEDDGRPVAEAASA